MIDAARAIAIPTDQRVLHVLPQEFIIDGQEGIREPIGMSGVRLEVQGAHRDRRGERRAEHREVRAAAAGSTVEDTDAQPLASSDAVLTDDEKELGVCLVDIGGGTTDIAIFTGGAIRHTAVIPIAGDQVTNDIAMALRTPTADAEEIKVEYGVRAAQLADPDETIEVPGVGDRPPRQLSRQTLAEVVEPRIEELYQLVQRGALRAAASRSCCRAGIVLTGGARVMEGVVELAEEMFHMPVRLGVPQFIDGLVGRRAQSAFTRPASACCLYSKQAMQAKAEARANRETVFRSALDRMKGVVPTEFVDPKVFDCE